MRYFALFTLGILTGLAFNHLPPIQPFRREDPPATPHEWRPKVSGNWADEDLATIDRYFNGGVS